MADLRNLISTEADVIPDVPSSKKSGNPGNIQIHFSNSKNPLEMDFLYNFNGVPWLEVTVKDQGVRK